VTSIHENRGVQKGFGSETEVVLGSLHCVLISYQVQSLIV
jgi:hypothetical protein